MTAAESAGERPAGPAGAGDGFTLADLAAIVARRGGSGDPGSYTAKLLAAGVERCAKKFGEEAVEAALAAVAGTEAALAAEAADVLYHLLVMLAARGVPLAAVMAELERRTAQSGLAEKAARRSGEPG
jgi:phosphoribosyl-ATP pyrophosphohydrolase